LFEYFACGLVNMAIYLYAQRDGSTFSKVTARLQQIKSTRRRTWFDILLAIGLVVAFCASAYFKLNITEPRRGSTHARFQILWLFQPCYVTQLVHAFSTRLV
jgi:H+/Cl- antiporter ClcA